MSHNVVKINSIEPNVSGEVLLNVEPLPIVNTETSSMTLSVPSTGNSQIIRVNSTGPVTITLPVATTNDIGFRYEIKQVNSGAVTIGVQGSDTIDGSTTHVINSQYDSRTVICVASNVWELY